MKEEVLQFEVPIKLGSSYFCSSPLQVTVKQNDIPGTVALYRLCPGFSWALWELRRGKEMMPFLGMRAGQEDVGRWPGGGEGRLDIAAGKGRESCEHSFCFALTRGGVGTWISSFPAWRAGEPLRGTGGTLPREGQCPLGAHTTLPLVFALIICKCALVLCFKCEVAFCEGI